MLSSYDHQTAIAHQRTGEIRAYFAQHQLTRLALTNTRASRGLRRGMMRPVIQLSNRAGRWLLDLSARLDDLNAVDEPAIRRVPQVR